MFVINTRHGYLIRENGWTLYTAKKERATRFATREDATAAKPGHHKDMGGGGFIGTIERA